MGRASFQEWIEQHSCATSRTAAEVLRCGTLCACESGEVLHKIVVQYCLEMGKAKARGIRGTLEVHLAHSFAYGLSFRGLVHLLWDSGGPIKPQAAWPLPCRSNGPSIVHKVLACR